ncbi:MAG: glycosyltransferase [Bacteroidales bacterium]
MELSVIIVNYNVRYFLEQCLNSVVRASEGISCEIFVVDNNSEDDSCKMVGERFPEVRLIRNSYNAGYAKACNQALAIASGEFILLLNPDTIVGENTFRRCIEFMRSNEDAGAVGVKMINGSGRYLKESKRSLPVPLTAFFKMTGLSRLFPRSPLFSKYYMAHIDENKTSEIEILTGAFMFIRKKVLDKTGFFDENFFMYGEDIDLSYRILKEGYKIYYFPEEKIIHFKGESAHQMPVNSTIYFYKAMLVFAEKHFRKKDVILFHFLIKPAVYSRAVISLLKKVFVILLPLISDIAAISAGVLATVLIMGARSHGLNSDYSPLPAAGLLALFILPGVISIFLAGGYRKPAHTIGVLKGLIPGCIVILALYDFINGEMGFASDAILTGCFAVLITVPLFRIILASAGFKDLKNPFSTVKNAVVAGSRESYFRICDLVKETGQAVKIKGRVSLLKNDHGDEIVGNIDQLQEIINIHRIKVIFFSLRDLPLSQLISHIEKISALKITIRLVPEGENVITGSKTIIAKDSVY